jgi:hypothetical protein
MDKIMTPEYLQSISVHTFRKQGFGQSKVSFIKFCAIPSVTRMVTKTSAYMSFKVKSRSARVRNKRIYIKPRIPFPHDFRPHG